MKFLLDTVILSQPEKPTPHSAVMRWLEEHNEEEKFISVVSIAEIRMGIAMMPGGRRRVARSQFLETELPLLFPDRILPVSMEIADECGKLLGEARKSGFDIDPMDGLIAATARVHGLTVVTLNVKHFNKLQVRLVKLES